MLDDAIIGLTYFGLGIRQSKPIAYSISSERLKQYRVQELS